jgi:hypothetical protein
MWISSALVRGSVGQATTAWKNHLPRLQFIQFGLDGVDPFHRCCDDFRIGLQPVRSGQQRKAVVAVLVSSRNREETSVRATDTS